MSLGEEQLGGIKSHFCTAGLWLHIGTCHLQENSSGQWDGPHKGRGWPERSGCPSILKNHQDDKT